MKRFDLHARCIRRQLRLARETDEWRLVVEDLEQVELIRRRRDQLVSALEDMDAAGAAARRPAGERDGRVVLIAEIDERIAAVGIDLDDATDVGFSDYLRGGLHAVTIRKRANGR